MRRNLDGARKLGCRATGVALLLLPTVACHPLVQMPVLRADVPSHWQEQPTASPQSSHADANRWWLAFRDPTLDAVVQQALMQNLGVAQARQRLLAARALAGAARNEFRPILRAGTRAAPDPDATTSYLQSSIDVEWELGLFGRSKGSRRIVEASVQASVAELDGARVALVAEVARDYLELRSAQQQKVLLQSIAAAAMAREALTQRQLSLQLATRADRVAAQSDTLQAQAALAEPELRIATAARQLGLLSGQTEPSPVLLQTAALPVPALAPPDSVPADLLRARPDIQRAESEVLAAAGELGVAQADLYPRLSLVGAIVAVVTVTGGEFGFGRAIPSVGPGIDIPLFDWGMRQARVTAKHAGLEAAVLGYRASVLGAIAETETALASVRVQQQHADLIRQQTVALQQASQLVDRSRALGLADDFDRNRSQVAWMRSQLELLDADHARGLAFVTLCKALGGVPPAATDDRE